MPCCFAAWLWIISWNHWIQSCWEQTADGKFSLLWNQVIHLKVKQFLRLLRLGHKRNCYFAFSPKPPGNLFSSDCGMGLVLILPDALSVAYLVSLSHRDRIFWILPFAFLLTSKGVPQPIQSGYCPRLECLCFYDFHCCSPGLLVTLTSSLMHNLLREFPQRVPTFWDYSLGHFD